MVVRCLHPQPFMLNPELSSDDELAHDVPELDDGKKLNLAEPAAKKALTPRISTDPWLMRPLGDGDHVAVVPAKVEMSKRGLLPPAPLPCITRAQPTETKPTIWARGKPKPKHRTQKQLEQAATLDAELDAIRTTTEQAGTEQVKLHACTTLDMAVVAKAPGVSESKEAAIVGRKAEPARSDEEAEARVELDVRLSVILPSTEQNPQGGAERSPATIAADGVPPGDVGAKKLEKMPALSSVVASTNLLPTALGSSKGGQDDACSRQSDDGVATCQLKPSRPAQSEDARRRRRRALTAKPTISSSVPAFDVQRAASDLLDSLAAGPLKLTTPKQSLLPVTATAPTDDTALPNHCTTAAQRTLSVIVSPGTSAPAAACAMTPAVVGAPCRHAGSSCADHGSGNAISAASVDESAVHTCAACRSSGEGASRGIADFHAALRSILLQRGQTRSWLLGPLNVEARMTTMMTKAAWTTSTGTGVATAMPTTATAVATPTARTAAAAALAAAATVTVATTAAEGATSTGDSGRVDVGKHHESSQRRKRNWNTCEWQRSYAE